VRVLLQLWLSRLLMMLTAGLLVVALAWLPAGIEWIEDLTPEENVPASVRVEPMQPFTVRADPGSAEQVRVHWSWRQYGQTVTGYIGELAAGEVLLRTHEWRGSDYVEVTQPLLPLLRERMLVSLELLGVALGVGAAVGILVGALILRRGLVQAISVGVSVVGLALPEFVIIIMMHMLTTFSYRSFGVRLYSVLGPAAGERGWLPPLVALSLGPMAYTARLVATALDEVMHEEYIRTARAKGVPEVQVVMKHALRSALARVLGGVPTMVNITLSSLLVVEVLTNIHGLGAWLMQSYDSAVIATTGLVFCLWFGLVDGLANTLRIVVNPRLKEGS